MNVHQINNRLVMFKYKLNYSQNKCPSVFLLWYFMYYETNYTKTTLNLLFTRNSYNIFLNVSYTSVYKTFSLTKKIGIENGKLSLLY